MLNTQNKPSAATVALIIIATIMVGYILMIGKDLLLPLVIALLMFYILQSMTKKLGKLQIKGCALPSPIRAGLSIAIVLGIVIYLFSLAATSVYGIVQQAPQYQQQINEWIREANMLLANYDIDASMLFSSINITNLIRGTANTITGIAQYSALVVIYTLFLALEYRSFQLKVKEMYPQNSSYKKAMTTLQRLSDDVGSYLKVKALMSFLTGLISYAILTTGGMPYAEFWGLVIFALNFIPTVGSILAVLMVVPAIAINLGVTISGGLIALGLIATQVIIGNILDPRAMGKSLNLSPLVILLSLAFWGTIWGPIGALLCVPLMVVLNIILAQFPQTRPLSIILSQDGKIRSPS